ncbi:MAG: hypothetical protein ACQESX_07215 [Bacteroidota bacterium]
MIRYLLILLFAGAITPAYSQSEITLYKQGIEYAKQQNWIMAKSKFSECLRKDPNDNERKRDGSKYIQYFPNRELGVVYSYLGDYENASYYLQQSISHSSSGRAYQKLQEVAQIIKQQKRNQEEKTERNAWLAAERRGTIDAYQGYLRDHPGGTYASNARSAISSLELKARQKRQKQQEETAWNTAKSKNTIKAYETYLASYPNGNYASAANTRISNLVRLAVQQNVGYYEMTESWRAPEIIK